MAQDGKLAEPEVVDAAARERQNGSTRGETRALAQRPDRTPLSHRDPVSIARHFAASGYFADAAEMSQAVVKIVAGEELGFGPMTAMAGIHIIEGKPALSANLIATCVQRSKRYGYRVAQIDDRKAKINFYELGPRGGKQGIGTSTFTIEMAKRAGLVKERSGWAKWPEAMLFARALTQGVRWFCPEVTAGQPAYTPEELGADVNERGDVIDLPAPDGPAGESEPSSIDGERLSRLERAVDAVSPDFERLCVLFGSIGAEQPKINRADSRRLALRTLDPEQADELETLLHREADRGE